MGDPQGHRVKLTLMFDGSLDDFAEDFAAAYLIKKELNIGMQLLNAGTDGHSAMITFQYAFDSELKDGDLFYILENDYMHCPGWISKVFELYDSGIPVDYLSLYDHRDKYFLPMYEGLQARLFHSQTHHWRTVPSTCGSFLVEISRFRSDFDIFLRWLKDYYLFDALINERKRVLLTPIPGLATHCMEGYLSPTINWQDFLV